MAKRTLLDMVQGILTETGGDSVNSISDTIDALDTASVIRQKYFDIIDEMDLPVNLELVSLEALGDVTKPTHMRIPENVGQIQWIKYDTRQAIVAAKHYADMIYKKPLDFVTFVNSRSSNDTTNYQIVQQTANIPLVIAKVIPPTYWTSFDDEYIVFDAYDSDVDDTLQSSKTICSASIRPVFTLADAFVPDLPENLFGLLYTQAKNTCFADFKETLNPKSERDESRLRVRAQRNKWRQSRMIHEGPSYGRTRP